MEYVEGNGCHWVRRQIGLVATLGYMCGYALAGRLKAAQRLVMLLSKKKRESDQKVQEK